MSILQNTVEIKYCVNDKSLTEIELGKPCCGKVGTIKQLPSNFRKTVNINIESKIQ